LLLAKKNINFFGKRNLKKNKYERRRITFTSCSFSLTKMVIKVSNKNRKS
jgi:hypothetical protein